MLNNPLSLALSLSLCPQVVTGESSQSGSDAGGGSKGELDSA